MKSIIRTLAITSCLLILAGCQVKNVTGAYITSDKIDKIKLSNPSKTEIVEMIGYPNISDDQSIWYYVATTTSQRRSFFDPLIVNAQIFKLKFEKDRLVSAEVLPNTFRNDIEISNFHTNVPGTKKNMVQQYVSTAGKYNKKKKKPKST